MTRTTYRTLGAIAVLSAALLGTACQAPGARSGGAAAPLAAAAPASAAQIQALAPTGALRVGLYPGSPTSLLPGAAGQAPRGLGYAMGEALARQLGVPFKPVVFDKNADVLAAARRGEVDLVFTNATAERKAYVDFTGTVLNIEKSVLLAPGSRIEALDQLDQPALRIGVSAGSSTGKELRQIYPRAQLMDMPSLQHAGQALARGDIDGFATNKSILFALQEQVAGSRVLPGAWGMESFALGVPKGRAAQGIAYVERFAAQQQADAQLQRWIDQAALRGAVLPKR